MKITIELIHTDGNTQIEVEVLAQTKHFLVIPLIEGGIITKGYQVVLNESPFYKRIASNGNLKYMMRLANYLEKHTDFSLFFANGCKNGYVKIFFKQLVIDYMVKTKQYQAKVGRKALNAL